MVVNFDEQIGEPGGFGKVYKGRDENGNTFACKMLIDDTEEGIKRFEREIRLLSRLNHPNVMKIIAYNLETKSYLMPLYSSSLSQVIPTIAGNAYTQYMVIMAILNGVEYLHSEGVIHRDLKPLNILYNNENDIVVTDFGLGIQIDSNSTTLTKGLNFGTMRYCSPEQAIDMHSVDNRTDIYAIGMIIEDILSNFNTIQITDPTLKYIIDKCTRNNRDERFSRIEEIRQVLEAYYSTLFGWQQYSSLNDLLLSLGNNEITQQQIINIANQVINEQDRDKIVVFFTNITTQNFSRLENHSLELEKGLVQELCNYWEQALWPFSYIDIVADLGEKIYNMSSDAEIKSLILYQIMKMAIDYNRFHAMDVVVRIFANDVKNNLTVQADLAIRLRNNPLDILKFLEEGELPRLIREAISNS